MTDDCRNSPTELPATVCSRYVLVVVNTVDTQACYVMTCGGGTGCWSGALMTN